MDRGMAWKGNVMSREMPWTCQCCDQADTMNMATLQARDAAGRGMPWIEDAVGRGMPLQWSVTGKACVGHGILLQGCPQQVPLVSPQPAISQTVPAGTT